MSDIAPRLRIAVVDDLPGETPLLTAHLLSAGYEVTVVDPAAQESQSNFDASPDLVLLNQAEACRNVRAQPASHGVPVILIVDPDAVDTRVDGTEAGADEFLLRPFHRNELLLRIRSLLRIRALEERLEQSNSVIRSLESALRERLAGDLQNEARI